MNFKKLIAVSALLFLCPVSQANNDKDENPDITIVLKPLVDESVIEGIEVNLTLSEPNIKSGESILRMPIKVVGLETAAYETSDITIHDELGSLSISSIDEDPTPTGIYRHWVTTRNTQGDVYVNYSTPLRNVTEKTKNGPLFDIRAQGTGFMGSGVYFYALPPNEEQKYDVNLSWDLSETPQFTRGVWSFGEGNQQVTTSLTSVAFSYYAAGQVKSLDNNTNDNFDMYWMGNPPFNIEKLTKRISKMYQTMSKFFLDEGAPYRVFMRENPHRGGGGTGFAQSFAFAYGTDDQSPEDGPTMLLAHEISHNWPTLNAKEPHALTAWYTEGNAEFYKVRLAYKAGIIDMEGYLKELNKMADGYYSNVLNRLSNEEAGKVFWTDIRAQRVPYGRGVMYLLNLDAQLQNASKGEKSLDDVVLEILTRQRKGEKIGNIEFRNIVVRELGLEAGIDYDRMVKGELIIPIENRYFPCIKPKKYLMNPFELGFDRMHLTVVTNLVEGSNAMLAGLKNGDEIISLTSIDELKESEEVNMVMEVKRDGKLLNFKYSPRGKAIEAWKYLLAENNCLSK